MKRYMISNANNSIVIEVEDNLEVKEMEGVFVMVHEVDYIPAITIRKRSK